MTNSVIEPGGLDVERIHQDNRFAGIGRVGGFRNQTGELACSTIVAKDRLCYDAGHREGDTWTWSHESWIFGMAWDSLLGGSSIHQYTSFVSREPPA